MGKSVDFTVRKNRIDMEHDALLQDRAAVWTLETGLVLSAFAIIVSEGIYAKLEAFVPALIIVCTILSILEDIRRGIALEIEEKREELSQLSLETN